MILIILIFVVLSVTLAFLIYRRVAYFDLLHVTHEKFDIFYGNSKNSSLGKWSVCYDVDRIYQKFKNQFPIAGFMRNFTPYIIPLKHEMFKQILITNFKNFRNSDFALDVKRHSIITLNPFWLRNESWKIKRSELSPALSSNRLKAMYPLMDDSVKEFSDYITNEIEKSSSMSLNAREISLRYSCNSIASTTYGINAHAYEKSSDVLHYGRKIWQEISKSTISFFNSDQVISNEVNQFFIKLTNQVIQNRRYNNQQRNDLLSFIISLKDKKNASNIESAAAAMTFFLNGFETSSVALCYALYEISKNVRIQEKLRQEITEFCGDDKDQRVPIDTLSNLKYLDQVFYETLRLHPPLFYITRVCNDDVELMTDDSDEKQLILKGTTVWIPIYSIHRDSDYYRNPDEFLPERFDEECGGVKAFRDKCVLLPFGDGSRICLGMKLGTLQVKAAIVEVLRNFEISCDDSTSDEDAKIKPNQFVNSPNEKIFIKFKKIKL
ncbi:hypothetical protein PVAND_009544 [Polypedilum vanderplanki]|uniref:Cytochrome P450 n=1 Tax=Polypedilum vanderplanki TaxID=319348 RepID=A0A9J6CE19_POLVA|nr:hypothetical protein PVAND_009544 [Polypedilum vanderplanki]